jgi:hypothetical protein
MSDIYLFLRVGVAEGLMLFEGMLFQGMLFEVVLSG